MTRNIADAFSNYNISRPNQTTFNAKVPLTFRSQVRPQKGDVVSFSYWNFSFSGVPIKPQIYRIRYDLNWDKVVHDFGSLATSHQNANGIELLILSDFESNITLFF